MLAIAPPFKYILKFIVLMVTVNISKVKTAVGNLNCIFYV